VEMSAVNKGSESESDNNKLGASENARSVDEGVTSNSQSSASHTNAGVIQVIFFALFLNYSVITFQHT